MNNLILSGVLFIVLNYLISSGCAQQRVTQSSMPNPLYFGAGSLVDTGFVEITKVRKPPRPRLESNALYPESLKSTNTGATVFVKVLVGKDGRVQHAEVIKSENKLFDESAVRTALQWEFSYHRYTFNVWRVLRFDFGPHYWVE